jgi:hypothetical protein
LDELHADNYDVLRQSKESHERKFRVQDQMHIATLNKRLDLANQDVTAHRHA